MTDVLLLFSFSFYFFKWRRTMFTFFLLFDWKTLLFVLLFKIPKKIRSTEILNELHRLMIVSHRGDDGDIVKFRNFEKSRYFRHFEFLKKSNFLKLHLALRCVYFVYPEGWNSFCQNRRFRWSKSLFVISISAKSPIWKKNRNFEK